MVTWIDLLSVLGIIAGICILLLGGFAVFGAGMSDAPGEGGPIATKGCVGVVVGLVLIVAGLVGLAG